MKSRREIIDEILAKNRLHPIAQRQSTLEFALENMQDAMLFQLAQELEVKIVEEGK